MEGPFEPFEKGEEDVDRKSTLSRDPSFLPGSVSSHPPDEIRRAVSSTNRGKRLDRARQTRFAITYFADFHPFYVSLENTFPIRFLLSSPRVTALALNYENDEAHSTTIKRAARADTPDSFSSVHSLKFGGNVEDSRQRRE